MLSFGIEFGDLGGRGEIEVKVVGCFVAGSRRFRGNLDVTVGDQFFDDRGNFGLGKAGFFREIGDFGFAVNGEKYQSQLARQAQRLVLDLQYALGGLGVYRLWVH